MKLLQFFKTHQQSGILVVGYILVAGIAFNMGRITASTREVPEIRVEEAFSPLNNTPDSAANQLTNNTTPNPVTTPSDCAKGQIKGNIGSSGDKVYHIPGGSFYNRTRAEQCFATESEAQAAGFRKSKN